jgi:hypothetical protein
MAAITITPLTNRINFGIAPTFHCKEANTSSVSSTQPFFLTEQTFSCVLKGSVSSEEGVERAADPPQACHHFD